VSELRPRDGARFLLERQLVDGTRATYRAAVFTPVATFEGTAELDDTGGVTLAIDGASEELVEMLRMIARLTARGAGKRREDGMAVWPARVTRWRGPGRGE
jgi:hypothetical protein